MPTEDKDEVFCICVDKEQIHIEDSILTNCAKCGCQVWESLHNADKKPICLKCVIKLEAENKGTDDEVKFGITPEDAERSLREIAKIEKAREGVFEKCLEYKPEWKQNEGKLRAMINLFDRHGDGFKRVIYEGKTYLVPIEDVICFGLTATQIPTKYKEEVK